MPNFDGDNLVMTLDAVVSQDVIDDWYEPWKDWMLSSPLNRRYPQLFLSEGGGPVDATQNQGSYIRVNNDVGWRIRPPEQNIEIIYTGSLLRTNDDLPIFIPTIGSYSTQVFNIQPITTQIISGSGVTEQDKTDIITGVLTDNMTEAYPVDGQSAMTLSQAQYALVQLLTEFVRSGATVSVKRRAGGIEAMELTLDSGTAPTSSTQSG